ncbi:MAG: hypothetical protein HOA57_03180 [Candidatus Magasanikbacteria bacterium]|jgi:hypothetical protein|nr:hypothetical protein [Candidatus Paceibacterota bacterium]MBT6819356.1 hypothetical protein [Candidatus Magasanikbacteria bacterium]
MTDNFELDWAKSIQKSKQSGTTSQIDPAIQKKQAEEELKYFKQKLREAIEENNKDKTKDTLKKLIKTRSRLLKITLTKRTIDPEEEIEKYYHDCHRLTKTVSRLLK